MKTQKPKIAVIGGSGLYQIEGIKDVKETRVATPFGNPSDVIVIGELEGVSCAFLPRHGRGHRILPSEINSRANIYALKKLGVEQIISISACGSLKEELKPRDFIIPDQIFDRTKGRISTFFGNGIVAHIPFDSPFCPQLSKIVYESSKDITTTHWGGVYVCMEGPAFSTLAESELHRKMGFSIIGMTALPEAKLAREAEICYTMVALVTDYDVWKKGEEVSVEKVVENLNANVENSKKLIKAVLPKLDRKRDCICSSALKFAIFTAKEAMNKQTKKKLSLLIDKYVK